MGQQIRLGCFAFSLLMMCGCLFGNRLPTQPGTMGLDGAPSSPATSAPKAIVKRRRAQELPVTAIEMRRPAEAELAGVRKLLIVPLAGPEDVSTRATSSLIHQLHNAHRFEVLELRDSGEVAKALQTRPETRAEQRNGQQAGRGTTGRNGNSSRNGGQGGSGLAGIGGGSGLLSMFAGGQSNTGGNLLSMLGGQFIGGMGPRPQDKKTEMELDVSGASLTLKEVILKGAQEQGADAILIGEVINYKCEDIDPRFHLVPRDGYGLVGAAVGLVMVPVDMVINVGEWTFNKVGRVWGRVPPAMERTAQVQIACRVIDLRNNAVLMSSEPYQVEVARAEKEAMLPREEMVLGHALDKCVRELVSGMAAPPEMMRMELVTTSDLQEGIDHARQGRMNQAHIAFEKVLHDNPADHAACYNIGVLEEARGDLELAARYYQAAMATHLNEKYEAALQRVQIRETQSRDLQARRLTAPPAGPAIVLPVAGQQPKP
jgi:hypothetical protein